MDNIEQLRKVATRAGKLLTSLSESIRQQKEELKLTEFYQEYSKAALYKLPKLSKGSVEYAVSEMEAGGYIFKKKPSGNTMKYAMTIQNVIDLYNHRKVPKYRIASIKPLRFLYVILKVVVPRQFLPLHYHMLFELILSFCSKTCVFWPSISIRRHL
jgi:hypothetical protein